MGESGVCSADERSLMRGITGFGPLLREGFDLLFEGSGLTKSGYGNASQINPSSRAFPGVDGTLCMTADTGSSSHSGGGDHPEPHHRFFELLRPERADVVVILLFSIVSGVLLLATPLAVDAVVNNIAFGGQQRVYVQALVVLSIALFAFLALLAVLRGAQHHVMEIIQRRIFLRITADLAYRLPRTETVALEQTLGPELVNRFFEVITVQKGSSLLLLEGINVILAAFIGLLVLGFYHPFLLAFDLVLIVALAFVIFVMGRGAVRTSIRESYAKHAVAGWLEQIVLFPLLFKNRGAAELALRRADQLGREYLDARRAHFRVLLPQICGLLTLQALASAALLTIGGALVLSGELTLGQLVASELIVGATLASVAKFGKHLESWYDAMAAVDKLGYLADLPIEREHGELPTNRSGPAEVELRQLTFGFYPSRPLFQNLSLRFRPGGRVAVVAAAGSGASTLLDILYGLRPPQQGMVLIDGLDVRHWDLAALRQQVSLVRGVDIVDGTIAENVRLGRDDVSLDDVRRALECVGLIEAVLKFPDGLDTRLRPGGRPLSSTQRIRLVLARAIIGRPRLLLLDELLEGLDPQTVAELETYLFEPSNPWTLVLVTRDPDLVKHCDEVVNLGAAQLSPSPGDRPTDAS
jgi:putative ABC transport system ATP-binding protein